MSPHCFDWRLMGRCVTLNQKSRMRKVGMEVCTALSANHFQLKREATRMRSIRLLAGCAVLSLAFAPAGNAQSPSGYPNKPVRLMVPYGAGGVGDQTMRLLANKVSEQVKQQIVIENRPGAGGIASMSESLRAAADGYTLAEMGNGQAISMSLFTK